METPCRSTPDSTASTPPGAVVVDRVRGGFDRDAFAGINLGKNARAIEAGSVVVTGGAERDGPARLALHLAAAAPGEAAVPVRLPGLTTQTPVDFLERVDRYVQAEPALRLRMAIGEGHPAADDGAGNLRPRDNVADRSPDGHPRMAPFSDGDGDALRAALASSAFILETTIVQVAITATMNR